MSNKRSLSLDALKGMAIILVMFGHVLVWNNIEDAYIYNMIKAVQMPLFIAISGYVAAFKPPISKLDSAVKVIERRAIGYLLPFFSWLVIKYWRDLGWGLRNVLFNLDRGLWFLMTLFILSVTLIIAQLISTNIYINFVKNNKSDLKEKKKSRKKVNKYQNNIETIFEKNNIIDENTKNNSFKSKTEPKLALGQEVVFWITEILIIGFFFLQSRVGNTFLSPNLTIYYVPFFLGGYFIRRYQQLIANILRILVCKKALLIEGILSVVLWMGISVLYNFSMNSDIVTVLMQLIAGSAGSFGLMVLFLNTKENVFKEKLAFIGKYTLEIYVLHFHFTRLLNRGIEYTVWYESWQSIIFTIVTFVVMSLITFVIIWIVKKYIPVLDLLLFGKKPADGIKFIPVWKKK